MTGSSTRQQWIQTGVRTPNFAGWAAAEITNSDPNTYPQELLEREQLMARKGKLPYAPWADPDAPAECSNSECVDHDADETPAAVIAECEMCQRHRDGKPLTTAECGHSARWKWSYTENYVDGDTVAMAEDDPEVDGRVFLQRDDDLDAFVDGDDVRCPETGAVHPAFVALLEHLGLTYADISTSDGGVHAYYQGEIPLEGGAGDVRDRHRTVGGERRPADGRNLCE